MLWAVKEEGCKSLIDVNHVFLSLGTSPADRLCPFLSLSLSRISPALPSMPVMNISNEIHSLCFLTLDGLSMHKGPEREYDRRDLD